MKNILLLLLPVLLLSACKEETTVFEEPVKAVKTITISDSVEANNRKFSGTIKSSEESALSFRVGGRVATVNVNIGDKVTKGQKMATLEQKEYRLAVQSAEAKLASAKSDLLEKTDALKRQENLKKKDFVAQAAVDQAQAAYSAAKSNVDVAKTTLENARQDFNNTILKAPFDGAISSRSIEPFIEITAGTAVFELQSEGTLEIGVLIPETIVGDFNIDDSVVVELPTLKDKTIQGKISEIGAKAEDGNAFPVTIELSETELDIRSGMTAQVTFEYGETEQTPVYLIPASALDLRIPPEGEASSRTQAPVFVLKSGMAQKRMVTIRDLRGNELEVVDGLNAGDVLIVAGIPFLREGQKVKPWKPSYNIPATIEQ